jgi:predicted DNA-binding transcriptional regulator AlpA
MPRSSKRHISFRNPSPPKKDSKPLLFCCMRATCPTQLILLNLIILKQLARGTNHEDPNYAVLSCVLDNFLEQNISDLSYLQLSTAASHELGIKGSQIWLIQTQSCSPLSTVTFPPPVQLWPSSVRYSCVIYQPLCALRFNGLFSKEIVFSVRLFVLYGCLTP